jgi:hypothetical protein
MVIELAEVREGDVAALQLALEVQLIAVRVFVVGQLMGSLKLSPTADDSAHVWMLVIMDFPMLAVMIIGYKMAATENALLAPVPHLMKVFHVLVPSMVGFQVDIEVL